MNADPVYLTPALVLANPSTGLAQIASVPGFEWVALIKGTQLSPGLLQAICDLVNAYSGAQPPKTLVPAQPTG